jgi:hypothetical protein
MNSKITALPKNSNSYGLLSFGESFKNILLIVDIQSRRAWAYLLSKGTGENILIAYKKL